MTTFLYDRLLMKFGEDPIHEIEIPKHLKENLNPEFVPRPYQEEAFQRFICYYEKEFDFKLTPIHLLYNMATGSGKTLIMAGLILYLYEKGYRNFLFFVPSTNIIDKTIDNFLNASSRKFLFNQTITIDHKRVDIIKVDNFEAANPDVINICFTTIQKLHSDLYMEKENSLTFEDFKNKHIVLISDEAHHSQALTKKKNKDQLEADVVPTWENTVEKLHKTNSKNLLLEFTATIDYTDHDIVQKYENKIIYRYDLADFRQHGYSKDVHILKANIDKRDRILQSILLNQYRQDVAGKHGVFLKPVILFKAQRTIVQSLENEAFFHEIIDKLKAGDLTDLRKRLSIPLIQKVFRFYQNEGVSDSQLAHRLKGSFAPKYCLNVNEESLDKKSIRAQDRKEVIEQELLLNRLEDKDNDIRAIFAVQKLNEGWDVLNLFDIVRLYTERDTRHNLPGRTTIAEAQLIGRGARYFPFQLDYTQDKYTRKYDDSINHDLRIIEQLHYHSIDDVKYISELRSVLKEKGIIDDDEIELDLFIKDNFKKHALYKTGQVYRNKKVPKSYNHVKSFCDLGVSKKNFEVTILSGGGSDVAIFEENANETPVKIKRKNIAAADIEKHIIRNALAKNPYFTFETLSNSFPNLKSISEFITSKDYLAGLSITLIGPEKAVNNPSKNILYRVMIDLLDKMEKEIKANITEYAGTESFDPYPLQGVFEPRTLKLDKKSERANGDEEYLKDKDWYVYHANYGTSEERAFVKFIDSIIDELRQHYKDVFLIRNERQLKIHNFQDGQAFEPDFLLYLIKKNGEELTYQLFIEPKGLYLQEKDRWKEEFLEEIRDKFKDKLISFNERNKYRIIGLPFYNNTDENKFKKNLFDAIGISDLEE